VEWARFLNDGGTEHEVKVKGFLFGKRRVPENMGLVDQVFGMVGICQCDERMKSTATEETFVPEQYATEVRKK
jgi:hypothetical protein